MVKLGKDISGRTTDHRTVKSQEGEVMAGQFTKVFLLLHIEAG
jgi:hypothetical protein